MGAFWKSCAVVALVVGECLRAFPAERAPSADYSIKTWQSEDGLPQNSVFAITQTHDDYLWIGTGEKGLVRFDGARFKTFSLPQLEGSTKIVKLFEDTRSNLWIGTDKSGVLRVDPAGKVTQPDLGPADSAGVLVSIADDAHGSVWLSMAKGQLYRYQNGKTSLVLNNHRGFAWDPSGLIWIGTPDRRRLIGLSQFSGNSAAVAYDVAVGRLDFVLAAKEGGYWLLASGKIQKRKGGRVVEDLGTYPWSSSVEISAACEDDAGRLIVATYGDGVYWEDKAGKFSHISTEQGLSHAYVFSLCLDRQRNLWVGTDGGGLNRVMPQSFEVLAASRGLTVQSVCGDAKSGVWFSINNAGVDYSDGSRLARFGEQEGLEDLYIRSLLVDSAGMLWAGSSAHGVYQLRNGKFQTATGWTARAATVSAIYQSANGTIWVGTKSGLASWDGKQWRTFTTREGLSGNAVSCIASGPEGAVWAGTEDSGMTLLKAGHCTVFNRSNGLPANSISSLLVDSDNILWAGTTEGLLRYANGRWTLYGKREGLPIESVGYLVEDPEGNLWMGSTGGIMRARKKDLNDLAQGKVASIHCRLYSRADGLPSSECTSGSQPGAWRSRDGLLWFPTIRGLASIDPAHLLINTNPPPVVIETVLVDGRPQNPPALRSAIPPLVRVPPGSESVEIQFTSLDLSAPKDGSFKYRLEGYESSWTVKPGDVRFAAYPKLPPGRYTFQVTAENQDGVWNPHGASLEFQVLPPFWRKPWFVTAAGLCILGLIIGSVHFVSTQRLHRQLESLRQQEALEKERARIARDLHDQLGANLTQVALLGEMAEADKDSPAEVEGHARQISQTARETTNALDEIVWTVNPSNDTLDSLLNYLCKYAQEYFALAGLRYRLEVPPQIPATPISPELRHNVFLAAKESVNNVVKHAHATAAWLRLKIEPDRFVVEIEDDGKGIPAGAENKGRNGLRNLRKRMQDIGGDCEISAGAQGGARIRLLAPLRTAPAMPV
ncbi:MAG TPA: two-component regulator propeller domain-containing protein [Verrucomicrobiae bacterium]|nr:two-component regulator propeller domain-containing protein [Verrucomicrobiae bacterium]